MLNCIHDAKLLMHSLFCYKHFEQDRLCIL